MGKTLETTLGGPVSLLNRMRLACMPVTSDGNALECAKPGRLFPGPCYNVLSNSWRCRLASHERSHIASGTSSTFDGR